MTVKQRPTIALLERADSGLTTQRQTYLPKATILSSIDNGLSSPKARKSQTQVESAQARNYMSRKSEKLLDKQQVSRLSAGLTGNTRWVVYFWVSKRSLLGLFLIFGEKLFYNVE